MADLLTDVPMRDTVVPRPVFYALMHREQFTEPFLQYLPENVHVYARFEQEALKVVARKFKHYSARTIVEVLRHESALRETGGAFKLDNDMTPGLARLFACLNPRHKDLFEFRERRREAA